MNTVKRKLGGWAMIILMIGATSMTSGCAVVTGIAASTAAEGVSVVTTGNTIAENVKNIFEQAEDDAKSSITPLAIQPAPIPPRKPTFHNEMKLEGPIGVIGDFAN